MKHVLDPLLAIAVFTGLFVGCILSLILLALDHALPRHSDEPVNDHEGDIQLARVLNEIPVHHGKDF